MKHTLDNSSTWDSPLIGRRNWGKLCPRQAQVTLKNAHLVPQAVLITWIGTLLHAGVSSVSTLVAVVEVVQGASEGHLLSPATSPGCCQARKSRPSLRLAASRLSSLINVCQSPPRWEKVKAFPT